MKKLTSLLFFIIKIQKKKISSVLEEKLKQKLEEKSLEEKLKELKSLFSTQDRPSTHSRSACNTRLARKRPTKKPKDALSAKARAMGEVSEKSKLPSTCIKRRKQKKKKPHTGSIS